MALTGAKLDQASRTAEESLHPTSCRVNEHILVKRASTQSSHSSRWFVRRMNVVILQLRYSQQYDQAEETDRDCGRDLPAVAYSVLSLGREDWACDFHFVASLVQSYLAERCARMAPRSHSMIAALALEVWAVVPVVLVAL